MARLVSLHLSGFKSFQTADLPLEQINVLIGPNGAGKSNLVALFKLLNFLVHENLQEFVGRYGGGNALLFFGAKQTPQMEVDLKFETETGESEYFCRLAHAAGDTLIFTEERLTFHRTGRQKAQIFSLGAGHKESLLQTAAREGKQTAEVIRRILLKCRAYQFHDTSDSANIRQTWDIEDNRFLRYDGANLSSFLYRLQRTPDLSIYYDRIVSATRLIAPFFRDFVLEPTSFSPSRIMLRWRDRDMDMEFGPHQLSDGSLRAIALVTLLLQPEDCLPSLMVIDEPELGLHPHAVSIIADLIRHASAHAQLILATQSPNLLDQFKPEAVIVAERMGPESKIGRLDQAGLQEWLEEYSLSELQEKNVLATSSAW